MRWYHHIFVFMICTPLMVHADDGLIVAGAAKEITLAGYTRNITSRSVSSEISGKVLHVNYDIGQTSGDRPFIEIDPAFIDFQITGTGKSLEKLGIMIKKAESRVAYLEKESLRIDNLFKDDMAAESRKDAVFQELDQARLELKAASMERAVMQNTLNELTERKNRHSIYVPDGWVITERSVEEGEVVQPGTPLAKVSDYRNLVVPLSVSNNELAALQSLSAPFDARLENIPVKASINWINPEFDEKTRKLNIELLIKDYKGPKRGGLTFSMPLNIKTEGLHIPKDAVVDRYENPVVTIKKTGETVQLLVIGESNGDLLVVEDRRLVPGTELMPGGGKK